MKHPKEKDSEDKDPSIFFERTCWALGIIVVFTIITLGIIAVSIEFQDEHTRLVKPFTIVEKDTASYQGGYKYKFQDRNGITKRFYDRQVYSIGDTLK